MNWREFGVALTEALAWPLVVVTAVVVLRGSLARMVDRVKSASGGGGSGWSIELGQRVVDATNEANDALQSLDTPSDASADPGQADETHTGEAIEPSPDRVALSKSDLERIVTEVAQAGWTMGDTSAYSSPPIPFLTWVDGRPRIDGWATSIPPIAAQSHVGGPRTERVVRIRSLLGAIGRQLDRARETIYADPARQAANREKVLRLEREYALAADELKQLEDELDGNARWARPPRHP